MPVTVLLIQRPQGSPVYAVWDADLPRRARQKQCHALLRETFPSWSSWEVRRWARRLSGLHPVFSFAWVHPDAWMEARTLAHWDGAALRQIHQDSAALQDVLFRTQQALSSTADGSS